MRVSGRRAFSSVRRLLGYGYRKALEQRRVNESTNEMRRPRPFVTAQNPE
jgi:hypothetical protein